jgi:hypothetical protein
MADADPDTALRVAAFEHVRRLCADIWRSRAWRAVKRAVEDSK